LREGKVWFPEAFAVICSNNDVGGFGLADGGASSVRARQKRTLKVSCIVALLQPQP
jgi:hypothetical protein